jgi:S-adenosylmethionine hydrolase
LTLIFLSVNCTPKKKGAVVFLTDYGTKEGAVAAMKGVAYGVDPSIVLFDITHEIPAYNIWEAAYRLNQSASYWPAGTVFVVVVDPGVGTERRSLIMESNSDHYFVTPDNGTLTFVAETMGIKSIRQIDEKINRRSNSSVSYTFHGRDLYAYAGARLASGKISFDEVGPLLMVPPVLLSYQHPQLKADSIKGNIPVLDIQYGNIWTNIPDTLFKKLSVKTGDSISVRINKYFMLVYEGIVPYVNTFGGVAEGKALGYMNSLMNFSLAINMGSFSIY